METKAHIRKQVLAVRNRMSDIERQTASAKIAEKVRKLDAFKRAGIVLGFIGYGSETDTIPFLEMAAENGKKVYCPVSKENGTMEFYRFRRKEALVEGYKKIPEPADIEVWRHRIGYGKGFYDRYLEAFRPECIAAVCFECQIVEEIPAEEFDVLPDLVVTEKRVIG